MKTNLPRQPLATAVLAAGLLLFGGILSGQTQTTPPTLPPGVQDVLKLVKAGLGEDVVLAQIKNAGAHYSLSADQIIYLHDQNVTQSEIKALLGEGSSAVPATPAPTVPAPVPTVPVPTTPPPGVAPYGSAPTAIPAPGAPPGVPAAPALDSFQAQLAPYGTWMDVPGYGLCWRPAVAATNPYWRPYCDSGYWRYTAEGWYWQSEYPWGEIAFHYGRWQRDRVGWLWVPAYDWAPAWVCWRKSEGYCGWAPLPPSAVFRAGVGLWFNGRVAVDVDFGLGMDLFTFVPYDRFWDHNLHAFLLPRERLEFVFGRSVVANGYRMDHGHFVVEGLGREHIARFTHREVREETVVVRGGVRKREEIDRRGGREENRERR